MSIRKLRPLSFLALIVIAAIVAIRVFGPKPKKLDMPVLGPVTSVDVFYDGKLVRRVAEVADVVAFTDARRNEWVEVPVARRLPPLQLVFRDGSREVRRVGLAGLGLMQANGEHTRLRFLHKAEIDSYAALLGIPPQHRPRHSKYEWFEVPEPVAPQRRKDEG